MCSANREEKSDGAIQVEKNMVRRRRCIDELVVDLVDRESDELTSGKGQSNGSTGRQISFVDVLSSIFNNAVTVRLKLNLFVRQTLFRLCQSGIVEIFETLTEMKGRGEKGKIVVIEFFTVQGSFRYKLA